MSKNIFVYYDTYGRIKEIINDESTRTGDSGVNYIYVYIGGQDYDETTSKYPLPTFTSYLYQFAGSVVSISTSSSTTETTTIPYSDTQDHTYFKDYVNYQFIKITMPTPTSTGVASMSLKLVSGSATTFTAYSLLTFNVSAGNVVDETTITTSQYDYLTTKLSSGVFYTTVSGYNVKLKDKDNNELTIPVNSVVGAKHLYKHKITSSDNKIIYILSTSSDSYNTIAKLTTAYSSGEVLHCYYIVSTNTYDLNLTITSSALYGVYYIYQSTMVMNYITLSSIVSDNVDEL